MRTWIVVGLLWLAPEIAFAQQEAAAEETAEADPSPPGDAATDSPTLEELANTEIRGEDIHPEPVTLTDPSEEEEAAPAPIHLEEREVPDYDGRGEDPTTAGEALLWIPRILVSPLYFVAEFVLRRPLAFVVTRAEENQIPGKVIRLFHFGPDGRFYLAPTATFDLGFRPNIGVNFGVDDAFVEGNQIRASYSFGGVDWNVASLTDRYSWDEDRWTVGVRSRFVQRPDQRFWGVAQQISGNIDARYDVLGSDTELFLRRALGDNGQFQLNTALRYRRFGDSVGDEDTSIPERIDQGVLDAAPPGYEEGYTVHATRLDLSYDSRNRRPFPASGYRISGNVEYAYSLRGPSELMWLRYGGGIAGYLDVTGVNHIFALALSAQMIETLKGEVPFTELPVLSGSNAMSGFLGAFLTGQSAVAATFSYSWPIWMYLDGIARITVGNVFGEHFSGFDFGKLRLSGTVGIAAVSRQDHFFEFLLGFGSQTFEDGADLDSFRILIGGRREF